MMTTLAEFPGLLVAFVVIDKIGRRMCLVLGFGCATVSFLMLSVCTSRTVSVVFLFVVRALMLAVFQTIFVYTAELLPTNVRAVGLGTSTMFARFGAMATPFVAQVLIHQSYYVVVCVYAVPLLLCTVASLMLKMETNQMILQDCLQGTGEECKGKYQTFD